MKTQTVPIEIAERGPDAVKAHLSMEINIHTLRGDEGGFVASNVRPVELDGTSHRYHEGFGMSREAAIADLAQLIGIPAASFEINFEECEPRLTTNPAAGSTPAGLKRIYNMSALKFEAVEAAEMSIVHVIHSGGEYCSDRDYISHLETVRAACYNECWKKQNLLEEFSSLADRICNYCESHGIHASADSLSQIEQIHATARTLLAELLPALPEPIQACV